MSKKVCTRHANSVRYTCQYNDFNMEMDAPIEVDGNKMTIKMSERDAAYKDVDLYTFQDQDNTQMHMYMPTYAFETFFANMQIAFMSELGQPRPWRILLLFSRRDTEVRIASLAPVSIRRRRE